MAAGASALVQKLNWFLPLTPDELASLAGLEARRRPIPAHTEIVHERQEGHHAFILQEGWACAYKLLPDGGRQVIDFSVPGDFMGLRSVLLRTSDHGFAAVTDIVVAEVSARQMIDTFRRVPRLGAAICGRRLVTRRWSSSIWSTLAGAARWSARRIFCWSWACACSWWGAARKAASSARSTSIFWRMRWGSPRST